MKIAINTRLLLKNKLEGIGWYTYEIVKRMVENHPEDEFIFFFDRSYPKEFIFGPNVRPVVLFPQSRHPFLWWWWFQISVRRALRKHQPDVFFSPDGYMALNAKVPTVMVTHDIAHVHYPNQVPRLVRRYYNYYVPRFLEQSNKVITVSQFTKEDILKHYPLKYEKVEVIYNASRLNFKPLDEPGKQAVRSQYANGKPYFFYIGSIHPRKNLERLLLAFDQFKQESYSPIKLLIAGRMAWQSSSIKPIYDRLQFKEEVVFLGYVDDIELSRILGGAMALTYIPLFEGFGMPVLEAMNCGVPVITSMNSALSEVAGSASIGVDATSIEAITYALNKVVEDNDLRNRLITLGNIRKLHFDWDRASQKVYQVLKKIALEQ